MNDVCIDFLIAEGPNFRFGAYNLDTGTMTWCDEDGDGSYKSCSLSSVGSTMFVCAPSKCENWVGNYDPVYGSSTHNDYVKNLLKTNRKNQDRMFYMKQQFFIFVSITIVVYLIVR